MCRAAWTVLCHSLRPLRAHHRPDVLLLPCCADNGSFYARNGIPFVMGTTGGDRQKLLEETEAAGVYAVIAPQMGKQVSQQQTCSTCLARLP